MVHETLVKFGYPDGLLFENKFWALMLRPDQITLGSTVIVSKGEATAIGDITSEAFAEFPLMCAQLEDNVRSAFGAQKFNYLALMMVDPHVHFHCIPRYEAAPSFAGQTYADTWWPRPADITQPMSISQEVWEQLLIAMRSTEWSS